MNTTNDQETERQKNAFIEKIVEILHKEQKSAADLEVEKSERELKKKLSK